MSDSKVFLITGSATGLGRALAVKLAERGYRLALVDFNEQAGLETLSLSKERGAEAIFVKADVSREEDVKHYVEKTVEAFGRIDYFANNAGVMVPLRLLHEYELSEYDRVTGVNLKGAFLGLKYVIPVMLAGGGGRIVNTVSSNSFKPTAFNGLYSATKHGLAAMTKSIGQDYQDLNIRAVGVAPNVMNTNIAANAVTTLTEERMAKLGASTGPSLPATPEEIAEVVIFAATTGADMLNGTVVNCAGGEIFQ
ncbi:SDR family NAD(P)-dependent oxidoreductase [Cohnella thailandensis]|uniref:SDR family oxidoreductase n=1 Tax=Cohnella thailandensis TaxID=557557 RepID=A0A841TAY8_9BACL|nr:SDR family oxidoreductase [Cohnella thailandensis]MBB6638391.1 SDR family oxidoreductase [Cohnella thailandensis]MBP1977131.1 NAD(P)-dependent dehydrogenase (short-subunit alcohol dehydrogenase family) [Cohnella thailandensis]